MDSNVIVALISVGGVVLSALISWLVSHGAAKREIDKMTMAWEHEGIVSSDDEFGNMAAAVADYLHGSGYAVDAVKHVASVRAKENGNLAILLDALYASLQNGSKTTEIDAKLTAVIKEKRKRKSPEK